MQEIALLESKQLRDQAVSRIEVLEKVKHLLLIPDMEVMTIRQVAEYYEVDYNTTKLLYFRNQDEINEDGVTIKSYKDFLTVQGVTLENKEKGKVIICLNETLKLEIPNRGIRVFPKRAILRIGMLLRDSIIAKEIRTQILNTVETTTPEQKVRSIDEELKRLYLKIDSLEITVKQLINNTTINSRQAQKLLFAAKARVSTMLGGAHSQEYKDKSRLYFKNLWLDLCERYEVNTYKDLNPIHMDGALDFIGHWSYVE